MSGGRKVVLGIAVVLGAIVLIGMAAQYRLSRSLRSLGSPAMVESFATMIKKAASGFVVMKQGSSSSAQAVLPAGYAVAYQQNPGGFKADAKLFDTWSTAVQLSASVLEHSSNGDWVGSSSDLDYVRPENRVDPWGHSLCILRRNNALLVISAGPGAPSSPICKDVPMTAEELAKFPNLKLLQSPSGSLVLVATRSRPAEQSRPAK